MMLSKKEQERIKTKRRVRVVELWALGYSANETVATMKQEDFRISRITVYRDRRSTEAQEYVDELIRQQLADIKQANLEQKLNYRDKLLGKLIPQKVEAFEYKKIEGTIKVDSTEDEDEVLSKAARILARKRRSSQIH